MAYVFQGESPAARLEELMRKVSAGNRPNVNLGRFLAELFDAKPDSAAFVMHVGSVLILVEECKEGIRKIPGSNAERYDPIFAQVAEIFVLGNLNSDLTSVVRRIEQANLLTLLGLCTEAFRQHSLVDAVPPEQFKTWHRNATDLIAEIAGAEDLPDDSRSYLVMLMEEFASELASNQILGARGLRDRVECMMTKIVKFHKSLPKETSGSMFDLVERAAEVVRVVDTGLTHTMSVYDKVHRFVLPSGIVAVGHLFASS